MLDSNLKNLERPDDEIVWRTCRTQSTKVMLYLAEREAQGARIDIEQVRVNTLKGEQNQPSIWRATPSVRYPRWN